MNTSPAKLLVANISNPNSPTRVAALTFNTGEDFAQHIVIKDNYVYINAYTSPTKLSVANLINTISFINKKLFTFHG